MDHPTSPDKTMTDHGIRVRRRLQRKGPSPRESWLSSSVRPALSCWWRPAAAHHPSVPPPDPSVRRLQERQAPNCSPSHGACAPTAWRITRSQAAAENFPRQRRSNSGSVAPSTKRWTVLASICSHMATVVDSGPGSAVPRHHVAIRRLHAPPRSQQLPRPRQSGHLDIGPGTDVPVNTPQFQGAFESCKQTLS
jgi:hypothetical protein